MFFDGEEVLLKGREAGVTHNAMELLAVIRAFEYIEKKGLSDRKTTVYTDSQYVAGIPERRERLQDADFITKKGDPVRNPDLIKQMLFFTDLLDVQFVKVKAHQKKTDERNVNREVDRISRKIVRDYLRDI